MVSKEKMASALDFDPLNSSYWSKNRHDIVFGANYNAFAIKFTSFSICHPVYDDTKMLKCVQQSLRSAMCSELPTASQSATFFLLPNWENKSINACRALVRDNPKYCTTLGFISRQTHICHANLVEGCTTEFLQPHLEHGYYCCLEQRSKTALH